MTIAGRKATVVAAALILSVSLNLFGAAAWGIQNFKPFDSKDGRPRPSGYGITHLVRSAPEEARETIEAAYDAAKPQIRDRAKAVRKALTDIDRLMREPDIDGAVLAAAFADLRRSRDEVALLVHASLIEAIGRIPAEVRIRWAEEWGKR